MDAFVLLHLSASKNQSLQTATLVFGDCALKNFPIFHHVSSIKESYTSLQSGKLSRAHVPSPGEVSIQTKRVVRSNEKEASLTSLFVFFFVN